MYLLKSDVGIDRGPDLEPEGPGIGAIQRERCVQARTVGPEKRELREWRLQRYHDRKSETEKLRFDYSMITENDLKQVLHKISRDWVTF